MPEDLKKLETLSYKPPVCALPDTNGGVLANPEQLECTTCKDTGKPCDSCGQYHPEISMCPSHEVRMKWKQYICPACGKAPAQLPGHLHTKECECGNCPEQPNQNIMIIEEIEGLLSQVNDKLDKLEEPWKYNYKTPEKSRAIEEIDLFQKTTLFELRKAFE